MTAKNILEERPRVLVVDDDMTLLILAGEALEKSGFSMVEAGDGVEALALFDSVQPEIILLDVLMPKMDGFETCAALRRLPGGNAVPVVMMTGLDDIDSINRAYESGATDFITKPINWVILSHRLRYMMRASRTTNELRKSEAKNAAILKAIPDLMFRMSKEGVFHEVRVPKDGALLLPPEVFRGKRLCDVTSHEVADLAMKHIEQALTGSSTQVFEYSLRFSDKVRCFEARIVAVEEDEVLCIVRDISEKKKMEEDLLQTKKLETVGTLAGGIAHDFNNLLTVILANISMVQEQLEPASLHRKRLAEAEKASLHARDLTQRFITFSNGGTPFKRPASLGTLVKEILSLAGNDSCVTFTCSFPGELWPVEVDPAQMRQAICNIVANAEESMQQGGVVKIHAQNMEVKPEGEHAQFPMKEGKYVRLSIKDHGVGIDRENLHKVFDPYFSTKERGSRKGMGLGLTAAYSIIKKHGGHINLESEPGLGTIFHVYLPAAEQGKLC